MEHAHGLIVASMLTPCSTHAEREAAASLLDRIDPWRRAVQKESGASSSVPTVTADTVYHKQDFVERARALGVCPASAGLATTAAAGPDRGAGAVERFVPPESEAAKMDRALLGMAEVSGGAAANAFSRGAASGLGLRFRRRRLPSGAAELLPQR